MKKQKKFEHGGNIEAFAKKLKCKQKKIIDLSSNINFLKPKIKTNFNKLDISSYPTYEKLYRSISKQYGVNASELELFNGGSSAIFTLFKYFNLKTCTIYSPAYLEYKKAAETHNYKIKRINRFERLYKEVKEKSLVIFVNPSTPDGKYYNLDLLIRTWIKKDATILIDESFLDFAQKTSAIKYMKKYDKLYILKSMTKFYSSAGIRVGSIISSKKNIKKLKKNEPLWKLSLFDSTYLQEALKDKKFKRKTVEKNRRNKKKLKKVLNASPIVKKVYKSHANYFLVQLQDITATTLQKKLEKHKIMIRDCSNFDFLNQYYVRIAVKNKKSIQTLKKALKKIKN